MTESKCVHTAVIMAGGVGERFWPVSRQDKPKQLLPFNQSDKSMLHEVVEHAAALVKMDNVFIITSRQLEQPIRDAALPIREENIIVEPCKRNTTGALAYMAAYLMAHYPDRVPEQISMAVLTVDYRVGDCHAFLRSAHAAMKVADEEDALVAYGVVPTCPATGLGYIETAPNCNQKFPPSVFKAVAFHEKPELEQAQKFLASKRYYWNSGLFFWRIAVFLKELAETSPQVVAIIKSMQAALINDNIAVAQKQFAELENISIDYALMEHAGNVMMVEAALDSPDVGTWTALRRDEHLDKDGNYREGDPVVLDCRDCTIVNASGAEKMAVAALGLKGVTVVVTDDAVLVMESTKEQDVRRVVEELKSRGASQV
ncbi:MAG: mannose-1-phosphate guanylyltransferase [Candidatus Hydrogenedentes bacterium]|nr:mannose-1-phosphate guanylyltransferase [Candidatus Hydrogenedentota bacterium]